jgi:hypothetical protein
VELTSSQVMPSNSLISLQDGDPRLAPAELDGLEAIPDVEITAVFDIAGYLRSQRATPSLIWSTTRN